MRMRVCLMLIVAAGTSLQLSTAVAGVSHPTVGARHLLSNAGSPAFTFGLSGGSSRGGSFRVTVYVNGLVKLLKQVPTSPIRLADPEIQIRSDALNGLLKLAEAENFFRMPARTVGPNPPSEAATSYIIITTTQGTKRVAIRDVHVPAFNEMYAVLSYVSGLIS